MGNMAFSLRLIWGGIVGLQIIVLAIMVRKKLFREFPCLFAYLVVALLQTPIIYLVYAVAGYQSWVAYRVGWTSQSVVVVARWFAVCELCYAILGQYRGIWALAWRALVAFGSASLFAALFWGGHDFIRLVSTFDLAIELSAATVMTVFFLFVRFYEVDVIAPLRSITLAFCLYSCFRALNDVVLQKFLRTYTETWNLTDEITYVATLVLIGSAVYLLRLPSVASVELLPQRVYASFMPQANVRLNVLNEKLRELLGPGTAGKA